MKNRIFLMLTIFTFATNAADLSVEELRDRIELRADMYQTDESGKRILSGPGHNNYWRPDRETKKLRGDWSSRTENEKVAFSYSWDVLDDGTMKVSIKEFGDIKGERGDPQFEQPLEQKEFIVTNFEPVIWKVKNMKDKHYVVRFIPSLRVENEAVPLKDFPIAATGISISDNQGFLWADDITLSGKYSGVTTHRGTLILSYAPFKGAKEMGIAEDNKIFLNVNKGLEIRFKAATSFVPAGTTAKVYAIYVQEKKSKGVNSIHSFDSNKEDRVLERLKK